MHKFLQSIKKLWMLGFEYWLIIHRCQNHNYYVFNKFMIIVLNFDLLINQCECELQIVGTSKNFQKQKRQLTAMASDSSEESYSSNNIHSRQKKIKVQSFTPSTPPPTSVNYRTTTKRRKGIPHRAPLGGLDLEY